MLRYPKGSGLYRPARSTKKTRADAPHRFQRYRVFFQKTMAYLSPRCCTRQLMVYSPTTPNPTLSPNQIERPTQSGKGRCFPSRRSVTILGNKKATMEDCCMTLRLVRVGFPIFHPEQRRFMSYPYVRRGGFI
jgi:hypothetical protein